MRIILNGELRELEGGLSIKALLDTLGFVLEATAVQRNEEIVARGVYADTILAEGDTVELVRFVGGG